MTSQFQRPAVRASPSAALELAEVVRRHAHRLDLSGEQARILRAIAACRTAALGGHVQKCDHCQHQRIAYNSCRNRHCPKCQAAACAQWMADRAGELLPVEYFHVVFTLPDVLNALALANKRVLYGVLFEAVAQTLLQVAANPRHLGAKLGFIAILHTWGQNLCLHPHLHCLVPGGGLSADGLRFVPCKSGFFLPVRVLSRVFRGKFIDLLKRRRGSGKLIGLEDDRQFQRLLSAACRQEWVVYAKPPFAGPAQVLKYLSRYTHRIAISNRRLLSIDGQSVSFRYKDYAHGNRPRTMTLEGGEFLRRFLLHAVPQGFMRIRHFGFLANRARTQNLVRCRSLLGSTVPASSSPAAPVPPCRCPACGQGHLIPGPLLSAEQLRRFLIKAGGLPRTLDSS